jgi:collagenase-like PrtC family protease
MFEIVAPITSLKWLKMFAWMGVSNFYGWLDILNISGRNTSKAAIRNIEEFKKIIEYCEEKSLKFAYTLNIRPVWYSESELDAIYIQIKNLWISHVILNDILNIKKFEDIEVYVSSLAAIYTKESIDFWTKNKAVKRIILPRELSCEEKINLINYRPDLEFEIFVKNDWCYISNFACSGIHFTNQRICDREMSLRSSDPIKNKQFTTMQLSRLDCKVCELFKYKDKIDPNRQLFLKIVWREKPESVILKDVMFLKFVLKNIETKVDSEKWVKKNVDIHKYIYKKECSKNNCVYYKEIWKKYL